ncbi:MULTISPECIES: HupE/UreJ family protein [unclassified Variovorax]|uniref:HupE/UreJ family protein n=1 Tax=unclassified Variovorax TaxID=663243 RepID=UPI0008C1C94B|nr:MULTISPECIES: HupE/UreJ family protein [unclassified Variovorax]SEK09596.1 HupE / UreJ protein [Variovorax sp. OK202]SFD63963.1 HupE / UreJ protein [Variovorax sp. OK212]
MRVSTQRLERMVLAMLVLAALLLGAAPAQAHKASDAYLQLHRSGDTLDLRWDIALRDLDAVLDLDSNADRKLSWGEVRTRLSDIRAYALASLRLQQGQCTLAEAEPPAIEDRIDGAYLVLRLQGQCGAGAALDIDYRLFREVDPTHRGLLRMEVDGGAQPTVRSLDPSGGPVALAWPGVTGATNPAAASDASFFRDGIHHILIGYDHILFLVCLLLPAVLRRRPEGWEPVITWREAVWPMLGIVTMFTIAHSITLALAGLKVVSISPRIIEPGIAITIMLAAIDNIYPVLRGRRKLFSFLFGLIHGFGFAGALAELDLPLRDFVVALLQFNLGVEAGQLMVVAVVLVALLALRHWRRYPRLVLRGGSALAVLVAAIWLGERVFDVKVLPFS